jgi:hypothetical protein
MSMDRYEYIRDNGWKDLYKNDRGFDHGNSPTAKVISFFCKRRANEVKVSVTKSTNKIIEFKIIKDVKWVSFHLDKTLKYKRKWYGEQDITKFAALSHYVDQCEGGGYNRCIISTQEYMMIKPKK